MTVGGAAGAERHLDAPATPDCLHRLHELFEELWSTCAWVADRDRMAFQTAVVEITNNIIEHAAAGLDVDVHIHLSVDGSGLEAWLSDWGRPLDENPTGVAAGEELAEGGRGLSLARTLCKVSYERRDDENRWHLVRPSN